MFKFNPNWLRGFVDAEGCFNIHVFKNSSIKIGEQVKLRFIVDQKAVDKATLQNIGNYFGGGSLNLYSKDCAQIVISKQDLIFNNIVPFFNNYPLLTNKRNDFENWSRCAELTRNKAHLTLDGLEQIRDIKNLMNNKSFPSPHLNIDLPEDWVTGFIEGDGNFYLGVQDITEDKIKLEPRLEVGLHSIDKHILEGLNRFFNDKGRINESGEYPHWSIRGIKNCYVYVIPFFDKHPLVTIKKSKEYLIWKEAVILAQNKEHLTSSGATRIREIKKELSIKP